MTTERCLTRFTAAGRRKRFFIWLTQRLPPVLFRARACLDTRHVSAGMTAAVVAAVRALEKKESWELPEAVREAEKAAGKVRMCFLPCNLTYLRAGGRCGNLTALCGNLLQIHPRIEVLEGYLRATKKYRGSMKKSVSRLIHDYAVQEELDRREVWFLRTVDVYVARIRNKFADCRSFEIVTVHGFGYKAVLKE